MYTFISPYKTVIYTTCTLHVHYMYTTCTVRPVTVRPVTVRPVTVRPVTVRPVTRFLSMIFTCPNVGNTHRKTRLM